MSDLEVDDSGYERAEHTLHAAEMQRALSIDVRFNTGTIDGNYFDRWLDAVRAEAYDFGKRDQASADARPPINTNRFRTSSDAAGDS